MTSRVTTAIAVPATTRQITKVDNLHPMVPADPPTPRAPDAPVVPPRRRIHPGWWVGGAAIVVLVAVIVAALVIQVPYEVISPGRVNPTNGRVQVSGNTPTYEPTGEIDFVTVTVDNTVTVFEKFQADHDGDVEIEKRTVSSAQDTKVNTVLMVQSKDTAVLVAMQKLGYDLGSDGAQVVEVEQGTPADGKIQPGETIVAVDGAAIDKTAQLRDAFGAHQPGDTVSLDVEGADATMRTMSVTLVENPNKAGSAYLGVGLQDRVHLPFDVTVDSGRVLGPSAGLAFTLSIIDFLTAGELTGGQRVAVTGEIRADGSVGPIGGVKEKVVTVRRAGIKVFLVPADHDCGQPDGSCNYTDAKAKAGDSLDIVPIANLDDALKALASMGGNGLALGPPASSAPPG